MSGIIRDKISSTMKVLILGGNSKRHHKWIRQLGAYAVSVGHEVILHDYRHWTTGDELADVEYELAQLGVLMEGEEDYAIIAKSIGTVITVLGTARGILAPAKCALLGVPYGGAAGATDGFDDCLRLLPSTTIVQNEHDPYGGADVVAGHIEAVQNPSISLIITPGDTHDYQDFSFIEGLLT